MERASLIGAMDSDRFQRLQPRHRDVLRLAYDRKISKEIAAELGLADGTVKTYCTEAIRILDARNRRHAAELLHDHEAGENVGATPARVEPPSGGVAESERLRPAVGSAAPDWGRLLPFRYKDAPGNDLSVSARLFWIVALAFAFAIGFGAVAGGARVVSDLFGGHQSPGRYR